MVHIRPIPCSCSSSSPVLPARVAGFFLRFRIGAYATNPIRFVAVSVPACHQHGCPQVSALSVSHPATCPVLAGPQSLGCSPQSRPAELPTGSFFWFTHVSLLHPPPLCRCLSSVHLIFSNSQLSPMQGTVLIRRRMVFNCVTSFPEVN